MRIAFLSGLNMSRRWKERPLSSLSHQYTRAPNKCRRRDCLCWRLHFGSVLQNWAGMRCPYKLLRMILALVCSKLSRLTLHALRFCSHCWIVAVNSFHSSVSNLFYFSSALIAAHTLTVLPQCSSCESEFANLSQQSNRLVTPASSVCCLGVWGCRIGHVALFFFFKAFESYHSSFFSPHDSQYTVTFISEQYVPSICPEPDAPELRAARLCREVLFLLGVL